MHAFSFHTVAAVRPLMAVKPQPLAGALRRWLLRAGAAVAVLASADASAAGDCSRPVRVPVAGMGMSVIASGGAVSGVYPDVLRRISEETGCEFEMTVVPRARQEAMFAAGSADLLVPATRTAQRDAHGQFVPMMRSRAMLISLSSDRAPIDSVQALLDRRELRVALVRGFDYGPSYQMLLQALKVQRRLVLEADATSVARALERGLADVTLMAPSVFTGTLLQDSRTRALVERLRYEPLEEMAWGESGVYVSKRLPAADRARLTEALERSASSGVVWKGVQKHYPPGSYEEGLKPIR